MTRLKSVLSGICLLFLSLTTSAGDPAILSLAIENANVKPDQAMAKVLNEYAGRLVEFSVDDDRNQLVYEISLIDQQKGEEIEVAVDASDNSITETDRDRISDWDSSTGKFGREKYRALFDSKVTMEDAVNEARRLVSGIVKDVELESGAGLIYFEVELITDEGVKKVAVDLKSGKAKLKGKR